MPYQISPSLDCKTAVFFANALERSSNSRSGANVQTESETGGDSGDDRRFGPQPSALRAFDTRLLEKKVRVAKTAANSYSA